MKFGKLIVDACSLFTVCTLLSALFASAFFASVTGSALASFIGLVAVFFLCEGSAILVSIIISSTFQQICLKEKMGRVASLLNVGSYASLPIGELVFGVLYGALSAWSTLCIGAGIFLITTVFLSRVFLAEKKEEPEKEEEKVVVQ